MVHSDDNYGLPNRLTSTIELRYNAPYYRGRSTNLPFLRSTNDRVFDANFIDVLQFYRNLKKV